MAVPQHPRQATDAPNARPQATPLSAEASAEAYIESVPTVQFRYVVFPYARGTWSPTEVDGETVWLPTLTKLSLAPGAGGIRTPEEGQPVDDSYEPAMERIRRQHGVVINAARHDYVYSTPCRDKVTRRTGRIYHDKWEVPEHRLGSRRRHAKLVQQDPEGRNRWLLGLVQTGVIPLPQDHTIREAVEEALRRVSRVESERPDDEDLIEAAKERLAAAEAAVVPEGPAPRAPRRRTKKAES